MTDRPDASDDAVARDAWLHEALRHAPDADAAPPPALRDAILRQARATGSTPGLWQRIETALNWLARPPVAAGLAGLTLSTVIVVMWWNRPLDEAAAPRVAQPAPTAPASAALPLRTAEGTPPAAERRVATQKAPPRAQAEPARAPVAPQAPRPPAAAPALRAEAGAPEAQESVLQDAAALRPAPATVAAPTAKRERASAEVQQRGDPASSFAPAASLSSPDPLPPVAQLLAARGPALHWTFGERSFTHGSAQRAWFEQLRTRTAGQWQRAAGAAPEGTPLRLFDGDELHAEFFVSARQVWWLSPTHGSWRAPLAEADAAQLWALATRW